MTTDDARRSGRELALNLMRYTQPRPAASIGYATVTNTHDRTCDVNMNGGTLNNLTRTTACAGVKTGDRVIVLTQDNLSTIIGVIA